MHLAGQMEFAAELVVAVWRASFYYLRAGMRVLHLHVLEFLVRLDRASRQEARGAVLTEKHLVEV
jgi:hypothetical protein